MAKEQAKKTVKKNSKAQGQNRLIAVLKAISVILVLLILLFIAAYRFGGITFSSVGDYFNSIISGTKRGDGYPYYFESLNVKDVNSIGSDLFVTTDSSAFVLDSTARKVSNVQYTYASAAVYSKSGRVLLMDIGANSYTVMSKTKALYEGKTDNKILTGAIAKNGTIAVATRGSGSQSELKVYNGSQKEIFSWSCAKENIIAADISDNGKFAAVSVVGAENGELYSKVFIFDFDYQEPVGSFDFGTQIVSKVDFLWKDTIIASGEKTFSVITDKKDRKDEDLSLNSMSRIYVSDENTVAVILSKYGSATSKILNVYSKKGELVFSDEINSAVKSVSCDSNYVTVLTDSKLITYNQKGEKIGESPVESDGIRCFTDGSRSYAYFTSGIFSFNTVGGDSADTNTSAYSTENVSETVTSSQAS